MKAFLFSSLIFFHAAVICQFDEGFVPYNDHRIGSFLEERHELIFASNLAVDYDAETSTVGNLKPGYNYGFGLGYNYRMMIDGFAQSIAVGVKAEWYPNSTYKFHTILEADMLGFGIPEASIFIASEWQNQIVFDPTFGTHEWYTAICLAEVTFFNLNFQWVLQSDWDFLESTHDLDETFNLFKINYRYYIK